MESTQETKTGPSLFTRRYYWTNLAGISIGVLCFCTGYSVFIFIMSSLHGKSGLGTTALAVNYVTEVVTGIFLPLLLMRFIGRKWTLVFSGVFIAGFIVTNLTSSFLTVIPGAMIAGIGFSTMYTVMNTVVSDLAVGYAKLTEIPEEAALKKFFSILWGCVTMGSIFASLISAEILSAEVLFADNNNSVPLPACGAQYCDTDEQLKTEMVHSENRSSAIQSFPAHSVPQSEVHNLAAASLAFVGAGIILILTLLKSYNPNPNSTEHTESARQRLLATIWFHREPNLLLLILFTTNSGLMYAFLIADFAQGFVNCSLSIHHVGLVILCFSVVTCLGTTLLGSVTPFIPRIILFLVAVILNITDLLLMLYWEPDSASPVMFFIIAAIWGSTFIIWLPQISALYGHVFPCHHEEAYSCQRLWNTIGFVIGFAWSHDVCMFMKIYMMIGLLVTGTLGYVIVEMRIRKQKTDEYQSDIS